MSRWFSRIVLVLAVGALAGMFYDAVPKFSYAFIACMTINYHYETMRLMRKSP